MNTKFRMFLTVFIVLVCIFSTLKIVHTSGQEEVKQDLVVTELSNILRDWYCGVRSTGFKNITVNVSLAEDIQPVKIEDGKAEAVFYVKAAMIPKTTLEEVSQSPLLKGIQRYLNENRTKLTPGQIKTVGLAIKERTDSLKSIVGKLHEENGTFKVVCGITSEGTIDKNSVKIFYDVSAKGELNWEDANNSFVSSIFASYEEEERRGYSEIKDLIEKLYSLNTSANLISPNSVYQNLYNRINARYYADLHTSEASSNKVITCWVWDPTQNKYVEEDSSFTDMSYWNNLQYPLLPVTVNGKTHYEQLACYNCADYVSQAMYYGGMQTDSNWNPSNRKRSVGGKWYWSFVPDLTDYMKDTRHDWTSCLYNNLDIGDIAVFWRYNKYGKFERYHVAMDDYSYGYYGVYYNYFAAHTNDVRGQYYDSSSKYLYKVSCWRFAP